MSSAVLPVIPHETDLCSGRIQREDQRRHALPRNEAHRRLLNLAAACGLLLLLHLEPLHPSGDFLFCLRREEMADEFRTVPRCIVDTMFAVGSADHYLTGVRAPELHMTEHSNASLPVRLHKWYKLVPVFPELFQIQVLNYCLKRVMAENIHEFLPAQIPVYYHERHAVQIISVLIELSR